MTSGDPKLVYMCCNSAYPHAPNCPRKPKTAVLPSPLIRFSEPQDPDRWAISSTQSILQGAIDFAGDVMREHEPGHACRRCAMAAMVRASMRVLMEEIDKVIPPRKETR